MRLLDHAQRLLHLLPPVRTIMDDNVRLQRQLVELAAELATVRAAGGIAERAAAELPKLREQVKELKEEAHQARGEAQALLLRLEAVGRGLHLYRLLREVTAPPTGKHAVFIEKVDEWERKHGRVVDTPPIGIRTDTRELLYRQPDGSLGLVAPPPPAAPVVQRVGVPRCTCAMGTCTIHGALTADRAPNMRAHRWKRPVLESTPCLDCGVRFEHARGPCPGPKGGDGG